MVPANSASDPNSPASATSATSGSDSDSDPSDFSNGASVDNASGNGAGKSGGGASAATGKGSGKSNVGVGVGAGTPTTTTGQPMPQKIGGDDSTGTAPPLGPLTTPQIHAAAGPKVSKAECKKVFDKYIELAIASNRALADVPPDVIKEAFAQAAAQQANPCDGEGISRNQFKCAMKSTSTDAWQTCLK